MAGTERLTLSEKRNILNASVRRRLSLLEDLGYEGPVVSLVGADQSGYAAKAVYRNSGREREVSVSIHDGEFGDEAMISIWRLPYRTFEKDLISFPVLIWKRRPEFDLGRLNLRNYNGTLEERLDEYLAVHASLLASEAADILGGDAWVEGLCDR